MLTTSRSRTVCRFHGARGGAPRGQANGAYRHGLYTAKAADGTPGAEGLSGLAKAFFYAGSRALLVSHWPVVSDAAVAITTRMLKEAAKPGIGRSEAHRLAMMALIEDTDHPHFAHPMFWAPFVVVGEGGLALR